MVDYPILSLLLSTWKDIAESKFPFPLFAFDLSLWGLGLGL